MSTATPDPKESSLVSVKSLPEFILDNTLQSILTPGNEHYPEVYLMLQDQHVAQQRELYNKHRDSLQHFYKWREIEIPKYYHFYLLVLMERFEKDLMPPWAIIWLNAYKTWCGNRVGICTICGIMAMGDMCGGSENPNPIYLIFDP